MFKTAEELYQAARDLAGLTFSQLASRLGLVIPQDAVRRKGLTGMMLERALGAMAGSKSVPDFNDLGIELKTLPLNKHGKPAESTFVTSIALLSVHLETWETSYCYAKLRKILWIPVEGEVEIPILARRIGMPILWSPNSVEEAVLRRDWEDLSFMIGAGRLAEISANMGEYLQVRPKAANGKSLCLGFDEFGNKIRTLPRGFYLRARFTETVLGR